MVGPRVYIGNLPSGVKERDIERFFRGYGRMRDIMLKNGFGFVEFDDYRDADDAVYELNGKELLGERVSVERARGTPRGSDQWRGSGRGHSRRDRDDTRTHDRYGPPTRTEYRLIVENLSSRVSWQDLKDYMRQAGEVTYADAHKQHRNEGVVEFASYSDMKNAIEKLDDTELNGRRIKLVEDKRRGRRSRSSSSRSRSRSRKRSRSRSSHSRSQSGSHHNSRSKSRERSKSKLVARSKTASRSASKSAYDLSKSKSRSPSRSRSKSKRSKSRSQSKSKTFSKDHSRSKSRSASTERSKSKSRSPSKDRSSDKREDTD